MPTLLKGGRGMEEQQNKSMDELLQDLKSKLQSNEFKAEDFEGYYKKKKETDKEFLSLLEWACDIKKDDKKLQNLLRKFSADRVSDLMEDLNSLGHAIKKEKEDIGEEFRKSGYRLLEQTRAGKKSDVFYGIARIFISQNQNVPDKIIEAFKSYYDVETFKSLMYAFLSSVIKPKEKTEE